MPLVNLDILLGFVQERKTIAPAFNTTNLETTLAIIEGIDESGYPGIIQIAPTNAKLSDYSYIANIVKQKASKIDTPISLHLDHGKSFEDVKNAVMAGFNSVMIDGASLSFEENIRLTKQAKDFCKCFHIPVEAELGAIKGKEDDNFDETDAKTDPTLVKEFVNRTGCDMLAVSIGNVHGLDEQPQLDFKLLEQIANESPVPLVLHGGSGISTENLVKLRKYNVVKINIASDIRRTFIQTIGTFYEKNHDEYNLIKVLQAAKQSVKDAVYKKTKLLNDSRLLS
ncbi:class II aldolase [Caldibacillus thermoamylovorans]|uniref:class II aldolase n=1 Tax=Caldibacillus thermoamylovorans TaxID=35841 RepID=UPI0022E93769|nr:class II aldolase [Caldibacillus thermoamylovorans]